MPVTDRETRRPAVVAHDHPQPRPETASAFASCELPAEVRAVSQARAFAAAQLAAWEIGDDVAYAAGVVVSEYVTNTVCHSGSPDISLRLARFGSEVWIEVLDNGMWRSPVAPRHDEDLAESGRGLCLVHALAQDCGVYRTPYGTCAWATLPASPAADTRGPDWRLYDD